MVFYRKYRPQTLSQLIGQDLVKDTLQNAFLNDKIAHAYLFYGPRGTGKTSTARILAKIINCEKILDTKTEPCGECQTCKSITDGSNLDLIEIDAASNRGIDDIRELRERVKLAPTSARKKVYIIDEVHMLTNEAFNALLKTLEEPPAHVIFILATTELNKIPQTILSRVQKLDFRLVSAQVLVAYLQQIADQEQIKVESKALELIYQKSEGSLRDALKILDQLSSKLKTDETLTLDIVQTLTSSSKEEEIIIFLSLLAQKDGQKALEKISQQITTGVSLKDFLAQSLEKLRQVLLIKHGVVSSSADLAQLAQSFDDKHLTSSINLFLEAAEKMKYSLNQALPLEVAVIESLMEKSPAPQVVIQQVPVSAAPMMTSTISVPSEPIPEISSIPMSKPTDDISSSELILVKDKWQFILETIKPYNFSLEALLKQAKLISCDDGSLVLEVPYSFHQRILEAPKSRNLLESVLSDVLGKTARVSCVLGNRPIRVEELANVEVAADDEIIKIAAEIFNS